MSSLLVQKALEVVDPDYQHSKVKKTKKVQDLIPESLKLTKSITRRGRKEKINTWSSSKKVTILEARNLIKSKEQVLKENLEKLKKIKKASTIELDKETTAKIIERAVTRQPVKNKKKTKKAQKTAFTEEDFKKFEEEYTGD